MLMTTLSAAKRQLTSRCLPIAWGLLAAICIHPSPADAAAACSLSGGVVQVDVTGSTTEANPEAVGIVRNGSAIEIYEGDLPPGAGTVLDCGAAPTVTTTNRIDIDETGTDRDTHLTLSLAGGGFEPGLTPESSGASEIEFNMRLGNGYDRFTLLGSATQDDVIRFGDVQGREGANLNAASEPTSPDGDDVTFFPGGQPGFREMSFEVQTDAAAGPSGGDDYFSALGDTPEFDGPLSAPVRVDGGPGDDDLAGGAVDAVLDGGPGNDYLAGAFGGYNVYNVSAGNDVALGQPDAEDVASYADAGSGVAVDLRMSGPQDTGGGGVDTLIGMDAAFGSTSDDVLIASDQADNLFGDPPGPGTFGNDVLIGSDKRDQLFGGGGNDVLIGQGGPDFLAGFSGIDTASYELGSTGPVQVDLRSALQSTQAAGNDVLDGVENVVGSPFDDLLTGNDEANLIIGLGGSDSINSLGGADTIGLRDGERDDVTCGDPTPGPPGDFVAADWRGLDIIAPDCEQVEFSFELSPDTTPPDTFIDEHPRKRIRSARAKFGFSSSEEHTVFECKIDAASFAPCASPTKYQLDRGKHRFKVRAKDREGNLDPTPATFRFRVLR